MSNVLKVKARRDALPRRKPPTSADRIRAKCAEIADMLVEKNRTYGDSALHPVSIFAKGDAEQLIRCRLDDKLSRLRNAPDAFGEDVLLDMVGYLVLLMVVREDKAPTGGEQRA